MLRQAGPPSKAVDAMKKVKTATEVTSLMKGSVGARKESKDDAPPGASAKVNLLKAAAASQATGA
eukprot:2339285-Prymnesium_polylepis.1